MELQWWYFRSRIAGLTTVKMFVQQWKLLHQMFASARGWKLDSFQLPSMCRSCNISLEKAEGATSRWANVKLNHNTLIPCFVCIPFSRNNNDPLQTIMIAPLWANHFSPKSWADHTHCLQSRILWSLQLDEGKILCSSVRRWKGGCPASRMGSHGARAAVQDCQAPRS